MEVRLEEEEDRGQQLQVEKKKMVQQMLVRYRRGCFRWVLYRLIFVVGLLGAFDDMCFRGIDKETGLERNGYLFVQVFLRVYFVLSFCFSFVNILFFGGNFMWG